MTETEDYLFKKWKIMTEQLITLCAMNKLPEGNENFAELLAQDIELSNLNTEIFTSLSYYVVGIIDSEERDKLIKWPCGNKAARTKFRKGMSAMVNNLNKKFPWALLKKLPESYFLDIYAHLPKAIDFLSKLINLAIRIVANEPELYLMHSGEGLNREELAVKREILQKKIKEEEEKISSKVISLEALEDAINKISDKCSQVNKLNDGLEHKIKDSAHEMVLEELIPAGEKIGIEGIKKLKDEKLSELDTINEELSIYFVLCQELLSKIKALKNPVTLSCKDFGCSNSITDLKQVTSKTCEDLHQLFQYITSKTSTQEEEENFCEQLKILKNTLIKENEVLEMLVTKMLSLNFKNLKTNF